MVSVERTLRYNFVLVILLMGLVLIMISILSFRHETFRNEYNQLRQAFNIINSVVAGREPFETLLPTMERFLFDPSNYRKSLEAYRSNAVDREAVIAEIRNFTTHLRSHEANTIQSFERLLSITIQISWTSLPVLTILLFIQSLNTRRFVRRMVKKFHDIAKNVNISPIPLEEPEFEEESSINEAIKEMNLLQNVVDVLRSMPPRSSVEDFIFAVGPYMCDFFNSQRFSVAILENETENVVAETAYFSDPNVKMFLVPGFSQKLSETSLSTMLKNRQRSRIINDLEEHFKKSGSKSTELILKEGFKSSITTVASVGDTVLGFFFLSSDRKNNFTDRDQRLFEIVSENLSQRFYYSLMSQRLISYFSISIANLVGLREIETGNHVKRVAWYAKIVAEDLNLNPKLSRQIFEFSPLHDIGKIGIPDSILLKPGKLEPNEWEVMKTHVNIGIEFVKDFWERAKNFLSEDSLRCMMNIISDHHERYDGKGYPAGKSGEQISIEGRIVALADVFDALTSNRPYKKAFTFERSLDIVLEGKGTQFDPNVVDSFLRQQQRIREIYERFKD